MASTVIFGWARASLVGGAVGSRDLATLKGLLESDAAIFRGRGGGFTCAFRSFLWPSAGAEKALEPAGGPFLTGRDPEGIVLWVCTRACTCLE